MVEAGALFGALIANQFVTGGFRDIFIHSQIGAIAAFLTLSSPLLGFGLVLFAITYQYLQTITGQAPLTNDENVLEIAAGYASVGVLITFWDQFKNVRWSSPAVHKRTGPLQSSTTMGGYSLGHQYDAPTTPLTGMENGDTRFTSRDTIYV